MINFKNTKLLGHRGARAEALENTWFGFQHATNLQTKGLVGIEFDVQLTADGHLVIFHDDTLERLCGLQSRVEQLTLREIQRQLQLGHPIMTLDHLAESLAPALKVNQNKSKRHYLSELANTSTDKGDAKLLTPSAKLLISFSHIELEIKTHDRSNYPKLIKALARYLIDTPLASLPIVLTSFDTELHARLQRHAQLSLIPRGLLVKSSELLLKAPNTALQLGCTQLGVYYPLLTQEMIRYYHRYHLPVSAWTVNDAKIIEQLVNWDVDVIITDIPSQLL